MTTPSPIKNARRKRGKKAWKYGVLSEMIAIWYLRLKGYKVLCHRYKTPFGEIDIIAQKKGVLCFIEVKYRDSFEAALYAVSNHQKERLIKTARIFCQKNMKTMPCQFDVILTSPWSWPYHLKNVWYLDEYSPL